MTRDEALEWLRGLSKEIRSQDNRATASPYYYDLRYSDKDGAEKHVPHHGTIFLTEKAAKEYIAANSYNLPEGVYDYLCWGGRNPELTTLLECIDVLVEEKEVRPGWVGAMGREIDSQHAITGECIVHHPRPGSEWVKCRRCGESILAGRAWSKIPEKCPSCSKES
ncbi:MAG: hypothetical protein DRJ03_16860 [Chloroflexi bacterium]|nr:MAG: hypothetical protein DRJ03_16860 [Chloroflexota bacterium]